MAYIHYDQKSNGVIYASLYESFREQGRVKTKRIENLGKVIDKDNNIFCRKGSTYQYVLGEGSRDVPLSAIPSEVKEPETEKLILDFGDSWFLKEYLSKQPYYECIKNIIPGESDTVLSLIFYRLLTHKCASCHAKIWFEGNYSQLIFPNADLTSQNISKIMNELGKEELQRGFFTEYIKSIYGKSETVGILIDSTGVPNATKMDITQISNHNGDISREVRLIYVIDRNNGMPIYFRYVAGNIIDVTTLITTVNELEQYGISINQTILDAGYFSDKNAEELFKNGIPFMTRLAPNKTLFKNVAENFDGLMSQKYAHRYGERVVFMRKVSVKIGEYPAFVYLCIDEDMYLMQHKKTILNAIDGRIDTNEADATLKRLGAFAILTSQDIPEDNLLPMYYTRQQVEQVFDISKNYADLLPIRVQTEQAFSGHLLICFAATVIMQKLQQELLRRRSKKAKSLNAESIFLYLRNQKCKVYGDYAIPQEARKENNAIYDIFGIQVPHKIQLRGSVV